MLAGGIDGAVTPELIPDSIAYGLFLHAMAEPVNATPEQQRRQRAKLGRAQLAEADLLALLPILTDFSMLLLGGLLQSAVGQVLPTYRPSDVHERRRQEFLELSRGIFAAPQDSDAVRRAVNNLPAAQVDEVTAHLHDLLVAEIETVLAGQSSSASDVLKGIRSMLGETSLSRWDAQTTNTPFAAFIPLNGARVLVASYSIVRGGGALPNTRPYLEFYSLENGTPRLKAAANLDYDGHSLFVSQVDAGLAGQVWILCWGSMFGDTGGRLKLRLYAFNGAKVRSIWQRDELTWGQVTVSGRAVTLEYDKEYHSSERIRETLYVTPSGLK